MLSFASHAAVISASPGSITPDLSQPSDLTVHPWFYPAEPPVIVACGDWMQGSSLRSLLQAFAQVRSHKISRLMILGHLPHRTWINRLLAHYQILPYTALIGPVSNTATYLQGADVCVFFNYAIDHPLLDRQMHLAASEQYCLLRCIKHAFTVLPSGLNQGEDGDGRFYPSVVEAGEHLLTQTAETTGQWLITTKAPQHLARAIRTSLDRPPLQTLYHQRLEILEQTGLLHEPVPPNTPHPAPSPT